MLCLAFNDCCPKRASSQNLKKAVGFSSNGRDYSAYHHKMCLPGIPRLARDIGEPASKLAGLPWNSVA
jgi:hypothetical protein